MQTSNRMVRYVLTARDLGTLQDSVDRLARHPRSASRIDKLKLSPSWTKLGLLRRDLRDLLSEEQNQIAKRVVKSVEARRELEPVQ